MSWDVLTPGPGATAGPPGPPGAQGPAGIPAAHHATHETGGADAIVALAGSVITSGTIADARLSANVALKTIDNAFVAQTLASGTWIRGASAMLYFWDTGSPVDAKGWRFANFTDGLFRIQALNDSLSAVQGEPLTLGRTGNVSIGGHAMVAGRLQVGSTAGLSASFPALRNTGAALEVVLGDNSNWATVSAASYYAQYVGTSLADLTVRGAANFQSTIASVGVIYPGRVDVAGAQSSWYLGSHASYGLFSNAGLYVTGDLITGGVFSATGAIYGSSLNVGSGNGTVTCGTLVLNGPFNPSSIATNALTCTTLKAQGPVYVNFPSGTPSVNTFFYLEGDTAVRSYGLAIRNTNGSAGMVYETFINAAQTAIGAISQTSQTQVAYQNMSDQRAKEDLGRATDLTSLRAIVIHDFIWKADGVRDRGVFAQEAHAWFPRAVAEGTDDLAPDGVTLLRPWMTDYSKFVPDLIAGWQQHEQEIAALRAELATLKGVPS